MHAMRSVHAGGAYNAVHVNKPVCYRCAMRLGDARYGLHRMSCKSNRNNRRHMLHVIIHASRGQIRVNKLEGGLLGLRKLGQCSMSAAETVPERSASLKHNTNTGTSQN